MKCSSMKEEGTMFETNWNLVPCRERYLYGLLKLLPSGFIEQLQTIQKNQIMMNSRYLSSGGPPCSTGYYMRKAISTQV